MKITYLRSYSIRKVHANIQDAERIRLPWYSLPVYPTSFEVEWRETEDGWDLGLVYIHGRGITPSGSFSRRPIDRIGVTEFQLRDLVPPELIDLIHSTRP